MVIILIGKVVFLFLAISFGFINLVKMKYGHALTDKNNFLMSAGITGFITLHWLI